METVQPLGKDRFGKTWVVLTAEEEDLVFFRVYPSDRLRQPIDYETPFIVEARLQKLPNGVACLGDISHVSAQSEPSWMSSESTTIAGIEIDVECDAEEEENFENRGIGTLLLAHIEQWAAKSGFNTLYGLLSPYDDTGKLVGFYSKRGYEVKLFSKEEMESEGQGFYIGKVLKALREDRGA